MRYLGLFVTYIQNYIDYAEKLTAESQKIPNKKNHRSEYEIP